MKFNAPLIQGNFMRKYKRFLADIKLTSGQEVIAHCTNSASMKSCLDENAEILIRAIDEGVEIILLQAMVSPEEIAID